MRNSVAVFCGVALGAMLALAKASAVPPPVAGFSAIPTNGEAPLTVDFTDFSTGSITNWFWDLGDSTTSNMTFSAGLAHTYEIPGIYSVELTVSGPSGSSIDRQSDLITVIPEPSPLLLSVAGVLMLWAVGKRRVAKAN